MPSTGYAGQVSRPVGAGECPTNDERRPTTPTGPRGTSYRGRWSCFPHAACPHRASGHPRTAGAKGPRRGQRCPAAESPGGPSRPEGASRRRMLATRQRALANSRAGGEPSDRLNAGRVLGGPEGDTRDRAGHRAQIAGHASLLAVRIKRQHDTSAPSRSDHRSLFRILHRNQPRQSALKNNPHAPQMAQ